MTPALAFRDFVGVAKRNLLRSVRTPGLLLYALQPIMLLLLLFRYILAGAIKVPGGTYVDFVVPAIFLVSVLVGAMTSAIGMTEDLKSGLIDRFRSLPMARSAVLTGPDRSPTPSAASSCWRSWSPSASPSGSASTVTPGASRSAWC